MKLLLVIVCLILSSCSSRLLKNEPKKYFETVAYDLNGEYFKYRVFFYTTKDSEYNCFKENYKNKEVITVKADYLPYAIDHFYKRKAGVSIKLKQYPTGYKLDVGALRIDTEVPLEIASCIQIIKMGLFKTSSLHLVSLRVAD